MGKNSSNELFQLVKSMNGPEKVYFKKSIGKTTHENQLYLLLFNEIDKQRVYNEKKILKKFEKLKQKRKTFFNSKLYLNQLLLETLNSFNIKSEKSLYVHELMQFSELLYRKGLYKMAIKQLNKAKAVAVKYEYFFLQSEILAMERKINKVFMNVTDFQEFSDNNIEEVKRIRQLEDNLLDYEDLARRLSVIMRKGGFSKTSEEHNEMLQIYKNELLKNEKRALTFRSKCHFYRVLTVCTVYEKGIYNANAYAVSLVELFEQNSHYIEDDQESYILALANTLSTQLEPELRLIHDFWETYKKLDAIKPKSIWIETSILQFKINASGAFYLLTAEYEKGVRVFLDIIPQVEKHHDFIRKEEIIYCYYALISCAFSTKNYSVALKFINRLLTLKISNTRIDLFYITKIIYMLIYVELGNMLIARSLLDSFYRFANKYKFHAPATKAIYLHFKKIMQSKEESLLIYKDLYEILFNYSKQSQDASNFINNTGLLNWLNAKINNKDYLEILKERVNILLKKNKKYKSSLIHKSR